VVLVEVGKSLGRVRKGLYLSLDGTKELEDIAVRRFDVRVAFRSLECRVIEREGQTYRSWRRWLRFPVQERPVPEGCGSRRLDRELIASVGGPYMARTLPKVRTGLQTLREGAYHHPRQLRKTVHLKMSCATSLTISIDWAAGIHHCSALLEKTRTNDWNSP
jgi:hypothetical protein